MTSQPGSRPCLPCPFCRQVPWSGWKGNSTPGMEDCGYWAVECHNCGRGVPTRFVGVHADNQQSAEEAWNAPLRSVRSESNDSEGYPGIAHDFETARSALRRLLACIDDHKGHGTPTIKDRAECYAAMKVLEAE